MNAVDEALQSYIEAHVLPRYACDSGGHDAAHTLRVYKNALRIARTEPGCDMLTVSMGALLHDADDSKLFDTENNANARRFLSRNGVAEEQTEKICEVINAVYHSLARSYNDAVKEIEGLSGKEISAIHIVGGGCKDKYLDRLTSEYTGKTVTAGPVEATALGNLISQLIYSGECGGIDGARALVSSSFGIEKI